MQKEFFDAQGRYVQQDFGRQPVFSSFLPGIAGPKGIPAWCNYNNRGQCVCSFGIQDKDHAIMEFQAATTAYRQTPLTGFRTFLKYNDMVIEPFSDGTGVMTVEPNALLLEWDNKIFRVNVTYFTLPNEQLGGLCRILTIRSNLAEPVKMELLDGMATIVPYGIRDEKLKQEANLSTAWMKVEHYQKNIPTFHICASMDDTVAVDGITGRNFHVSICNSERLPTIVDPQLIFGWDSTYIHPVGFAEQSLNRLLAEKQRTSNCLPCCFAGYDGTLMHGKPVMICEFYGQVSAPLPMEPFLKKISENYFGKKLEEARNLAKNLMSLVKTKTSNAILDGYVGQNFLDNAIRGGLPIHIGNAPDTPPVYLYSRRHGDPEREYNFFSLAPEYLSQGNGSFRDICQNRRSDTWIAQGAGKLNLRIFMELIQPDGYNPLIVQPLSYRLQDFAKVSAVIPYSYHNAVKRILENPFSPGKLMQKLETLGISNAYEILALALENSSVEPNADFQSGYWSDHWTYLLDLIENECMLYPEQEIDLLFGKEEYRWMQGMVMVRPQAERYCVTDKGIRQYHCIKKICNANKWVTLSGGIPAQSILAEKLLLLCAIKYATLDFSEAAIEMEGGKPGWYDALNGLPGLFGSSVADACELLRLITFLLDRKCKFPKEITLFSEIWELFCAVAQLENTMQTKMQKWLQRNTIRDRYREQICTGFSGKRIQVNSESLCLVLNTMRQNLQEAIGHETINHGGICPTYFYYSVEHWENVGNGILPERLKQHTLPLFLEGPTRWLKTAQSLDSKKKMVVALQHSELFDQKLQMYRLNASLVKVPYEVGRAKAFQPGWLENGSIWLHMEYKYLLSLLESGLYTEFFEAFHTAAIPFLPPEQYKRSTLENSSFLLSSSNSDEKSHGRGYVARLSGSTAEFISIWNCMFFGKCPFYIEHDKLWLRFMPAIPEYIIPENGCIMGTFLGEIAVIYHINDLKQLIPGVYIISKYILHFYDKEVEVIGDVLCDSEALQVRNREVRAIDVFVTQKCL